MTLSLAAGARAILIGGEPLEGEILMWWNFVGDKQGRDRRGASGLGGWK
ncbi:pirin-like C-terminal cupin domain-containing protein [Salinicola peritrichatus]|nr:pirin-like C-terminal cupin domain-containing protein [Salinicola peritrichatus]